MATAKSLNESYQNFLEGKDGNHGLKKLLEVVREHTLSKYPDEDVAQNVVIEVWRRIDPTCLYPMAKYEWNRASFSTWVSLIVKTMISHEIDSRDPLDYVGSSHDLMQIK